MDRIPIRVRILIAPAIIILVMLGVIFVSDYALRRQQTAFLQVVGGSITTSQSTTKLLLGIAEIQSEVLRYVQLAQHVEPNDKLLSDLRNSVVSRYNAAEQLFDQLKATSSPNDSDAINNIADFIAIHRAVAVKILSGKTDSMSVSTLLAHYGQLQSYIVELATRSLESRCGWQFLTLTPPWVAQRVWPIPMVPIRGSGCAFSSALMCPTCRARRSCCPDSVTTPAES